MFIVRYFILCNHKITFAAECVQQVELFRFHYILKPLKNLHLKQCKCSLLQHTFIYFILSASANAGNLL